MIALGFLISVRINYRICPIQKQKFLQLKQFKITIFGYFSLGTITPSFINLYKDNKSVIVTANGVKNIDSA
ncbi:hypothetical protein EFS18_11095 [Levilactobacillus brevis]|nr:hypothetical protein [Levilactobacillus brevis]